MMQAINSKAVELGYPAPIASASEIEMYYENGVPSWNLNLPGPNSRAQVASIAIQGIVADINMAGG